MPDGRITIGNVEVIGLSDARLNFPMTLDQLFPAVSAQAWEPYRRRYPGVFAGPNAWRVDFGCYLLRSQGHTILVDTGIGPADAPMAVFLNVPGRLLDKLQAVGVRPEEVEVVVLSHLHPDHIGWNVREDGGQRRLTFPRARYIVHRADWEAFKRPDVQASFPFPFVEQIITPLETLGGLQLVADEHKVTDEMTTIHTPGHTPGHLSLLLVSAGQRAVIWGDAVVHPAQVTEPDWGFSFDMDGTTASQTRHRLLERVEAEGMTVAACHFPEPGFGRLVRLEGRRYWQAL